MYGGLEQTLNARILMNTNGVEESVAFGGSQTDLSHNCQWNSVNGNVACGEEPQIQTVLDAHTVRLLMTGKEVGSIIGKKGINIKRYREESGARINISDGTTPERIVTLVGIMDQIQSALGLMCQKFEEDLQQSLSDEERAIGTTAPLTLRLLVPGSQCGSVIGKGGSKIKEIREMTSASIQVASDVLPQSTERVITVSGTTKAISHCVKTLCETLQLCPNKTPTIPYKPKPMVGMSLVLPAGALGPAAFLPSAAPAGIAANFTPTDFMKGFLPPPPVPGSEVSLTQGPPGAPHAALPVGLPAFFPLPMGMAPGQAAVTHNPLSAAASLFSAGLPGLQLPQPGFPALGLLAAGPPASMSSTMSQAQHTQDLVIPNELIGCVIGRGGNKINEIRQASGAQIKISNVEGGGGRERKITMCGSAEQVQMARLLIQQSIEAHRQMLTLNLLASGATFPLGDMPLPAHNPAAFLGPTGGLLRDLCSTAQPHLLGPGDFLSPGMGGNMWLPVVSCAGGMVPVSNNSTAGATLVSFSLTGAAVQQQPPVVVSPSSPSTSLLLQAASVTGQTALVPKMKSLSTATIPKYSPY